MRGEESRSKDDGGRDKVGEGGRAEKRGRAKRVRAMMNTIADCNRRIGRVGEEIIKDFGEGELIKPRVKPERAVFTIANGHVE